MPELDGRTSSTGPSFSECVVSEKEGTSWYWCFGEGARKWSPTARVGPALDGKYGADSLLENTDGTAGRKAHP